MDSTTPRNPYGADDDGDDIDLLPHIQAVWRHRLPVLAATLLAGAITLVACWLTPPAYEARAQVIVTTPKGGETTTTTPVSVPTFRALIDNQSLAARVIQESGLKGPPYSMTPRTFLSRHLVVDAVRDSNVINIAVRLSDPRLAADVANRFANRAVDLAGQVSLQEALTAQAILKDQLGEVKNRLDGAEATLAAYRKEAQLDLVKEDVDALLGQRGDLARLLVQIEGEKARLAKATEEIGKQERTRAVPTAVNTAAALSEVLREDRAAEDRQQAAGQQRRREAKRTEAILSVARTEAQRQMATHDDPATAVTGSDRRTDPSRDQLRQAQKPETAAREPVTAPMELRGEAVSGFVNPVYEILNQQIAMSRMRLADLEKQRAELVGTLKLSAPQLAQLSELYRRESQQSRLETEHDLARRMYLEVATRYEQTRLQVAGQSAQLHVLDPALPPDSPVSPRPLLYTVVALALAFVLSVSIAILATIIAGSQPQRPRAAITG